MNKYDYLHILYTEINSLPANEKHNIMSIAEKYFIQGKEKGLSEADIIQNLGDPKLFVHKYLNKGSIASLPNDNTSNFNTPYSPVVTESTIPPSPMITETYYKSEKEKKLYRSPQPLNKAKKNNHPLLMILIASGLILFNTVIVLGPFMTVWSIVISFLITGVILGLAGLYMLMSTLFALPTSMISLPIVIVEHPILWISSSIFIIGIGGMITIFMIYLCKYLGIATFRYSKWNIKLIRGY